MTFRRQVFVVVAVAVSLALASAITYLVWG